MVDGSRTHAQSPRWICLIGQGHVCAAANHVVRDRRRTHRDWGALLPMLMLLLLLLLRESKRGERRRRFFRKPRHRRSSSTGTMRAFCCRPQSDKRRYLRLLSNSLHLAPLSVSSSFSCAMPQSTARRRQAVAGIIAT